MKFCEKIVRLRKIKGLTQDELASAVGVSRQAVYKWECGQSYPEVAKLIELKALFGISIDSLLDESYEVALPDKKRRKRKAAPAQKAIEAALPEQAEEVVIEEPVVVEVEAEAVPEIVTEIKETVSTEVNEIAPAVSEPEVAEEPSIDQSKRKGFFSRIFGRR